MEKQGNKMPPKTSNSGKANSWDTEWEEIKS